MEPSWSETENTQKSSAARETEAKAEQHPGTALGQPHHCPAVHEPQRLDSEIQTSGAGHELLRSVQSHQNFLEFRRCTKRASIESELLSTEGAEMGGDSHLRLFPKQCTWIRSCGRPGVCGCEPRLLHRTIPEALDQVCALGVASWEEPTARSSTWQPVGQAMFHSHLASPIGSIVVPCYGLYLGSYKVIPKRNYLGA